MTHESGAVTVMLERVRNGDRTALNDLFALVYPELKAIAKREMRGERENHTLQPTALVNEVYLRLVASSGPPSWQDRTHFLSAAARAMKNVLVDYARAQKAQKRDAGVRITLSDISAKSDDPEITLDLVALDDALRELGQAEPRWAEVVELRFFGGLEIDEAAEALQVSPITVSRDWRFAKAWLADRLVAEA